MAELEKITAEPKDIEDEDNIDSYLLDIKDTIICAKLSLGIISPQQAKEQLELLIRDKIVLHSGK